MSKDYSDISGIIKQMTLQTQCAYEKGYKQGYEEGRKECCPEGKAYENGLNDAWECAKKIVLDESLGGLPVQDFRKAFNSAPFTVVSAVLADYTPQDAIARIKEYEEKQKQVNEIFGVKPTENNHHEDSVVSAIATKLKMENCPKKKPNELSSDCDKFEPKPCKHEWSEHTYPLSWSHNYKYCKKCGIVRMVLNKEREG